MSSNFKALYSGLVIPAKDKGVPVVKAKDVFTFGIVVGLKGSIFDREGTATESVKSTLYHMQKGFLWKEMEQEIQKTKPVYWFNQEQVTEFCRAHALKLEQNKMTLFFVKEGDEIAIFTVIRMYDKHLTVYHEMIHEEGCHSKGVAAGLHIVIPD